MNTTHLMIVRHVETTWNAARRKQGQSDSPPTAVGIRQAQALAVRLAEETFSIIYSSDSGRARVTAEIVAAKTKHSIKLQIGLRERSFGIFEGLTDDEARLQFPLEHNLLATAGADYQIPNGESTAEFHRRAVNCLSQIARRHTGEKIVVVTHGGVLDQLFRHIFNVPLDLPRHNKLWNAGINSFAFKDDSWMLHTWGDTNHLRQMGSLDDSIIARA